MRRITIFTSNQARHTALVNALAPLASELFFTQECTTLFPGIVADHYQRSAVMTDYFARVITAEKKVFGGVAFAPANARILSLRMGDLSQVPIETLSPCLDADMIVVFGSSWIKGPLADALIERQAINLHMGLSPWYKGTACNFWALYDGRPDYLGGTIHLLSKGLDSGNIVAHAKPAPTSDPFEFGMRAVEATQQELCRIVLAGGIRERIAQAAPQDGSKLIRYSRNRDFTDAIAAEFLSRIG
jgi:hypothetical protein